MTNNRNKKRIIIEAMTEGAKREDIASSEIFILIETFF